MDFLRSLDYQLLRAATDLGGHSAMRDEVVMVLADWVPYLFVAVAGWILFSGHTPARRERNQETVIIALLGVILALGVKFLFGQAWQRPRPFLAHPDLHQVALGSVAGHGAYSFPSVHALLLFTFAGVLLWLRKDKWLGVTLLALATVVVGARVVSGVHYPSDVLGGAIIGLLIARTVTWQSDWVRRQMR